MRRMITEKEADKLRFIENDILNGIISFANDDAEIDLDGDEITLWATAIQYLNPENDHTFFTANPQILKVKTSFVVQDAEGASVMSVIPHQGIFVDVPSQDPHQKGWLWNDNGTLKISLG